MKRLLLLTTVLTAFCAVAELDKEILLNEDKLIEVIKKADTSDNDKVTGLPESWMVRKEEGYCSSYGSA